MPVSWGSVYGYTHSLNPELIGVFVEDKRPVPDQFAFDNLGREKTEIRDLPSVNGVEFHICKDEKEARYKAKLAILSATATKIAEINYAISDLTLEQQEARFKLRHRYIDDNERNYLESKLSSATNCIARFKQDLAMQKEFRRRTIRWIDIDDIENMTNQS